MIYSSWRADQGGYDYFETPKRHGLADDLPTPRLTQESPIGIPSVEAGRPLPADARRIGSGPLARGVIVPLDRSALSGGDVALQMKTMAKVTVAFALGAVAGFWFARRKGAR